MPKILPVQTLLEGEYLRVIRLHQDLSNLSTIPHRHDHFELVLCTAGQGAHSINFKHYDLLPGRLFFIQKGQVHHIEPFYRDGWLILFGEELYNQFLKIHPYESDQGLLDAYTAFPYVDLTSDQLATFLSLIDQIKNHLSAPDSNSSVLMHYVSLLLLQANKAQIVQHPVRKLLPDKLKIFHQLKSQIESNFRRQHLAAFYAETMKMDIKKLNKICREATGFTLHELLLQRLVTECVIELRTSTASIKEVCYDLGFQDPSFFSRFFRKHTGKTPAEFRDQRQ